MVVMVFNICTWMDEDTYKEWFDSNEEEDAKPAPKEGGGWGAKGGTWQDCNLLQDVLYSKNVEFLTAPSFIIEAKFTDDDDYFN